VFRALRVARRNLLISVYKVSLVLRSSFGLSKTLFLFAIAAAALIVAITAATMPSSATVEAHGGAGKAACRTEQVALDEGYGVSRIAERQVCENL